MTPTNMRYMVVEPNPPQEPRVAYIAVGAGGGTLESLLTAPPSPPPPPPPLGSITLITPGSGITVSGGSGPTATISAIAGATIGESVSGGTVGSVLYVGTGGVLAQDNAHLFYDTVNHREGLNTTTPAQLLDVNGIAQVRTGIIVPRVYPPADSTTAITWTKADGTTVIATLDTVNGRFGLGITPSYVLDVNGSGRFAGAVITGIIRPITDSVGAIQVQNAAGSATYGQWDTTAGHGWLGLGVTPTQLLDVNGNVYARGATITPLIAPASDAVNALRLTSAGAATTIVSLDTVNGRVGINNTTPGVTLDVTGNGRFTGAVYAGVVRPITDSTTAYIIQNVAGTLNAGVWDTTHGWLGIQVVPTTLFTVGSGALTATVYVSTPGVVSANGYVGRPGTGGTAPGNVMNLNYSAPNVQLWVDSTNLGNITVASDRRLKENIRPLVDGTSIIRLLRPSTFEWINKDSGEGTQYGFIAQDHEDDLPDFVSTLDIPVPEVGIGDGVRRFDYNALFAPIVQMLQELDARLSTVEEVVEEA